MNFPADNQPSRVVIRDVADALLAREVAWALFGPDEACPQGEHEHQKLGKMCLPILQYNFRSDAQGFHNETGSTDTAQFGPVGIQFLWHRFSALYVGNKPTKNGECPPERLNKAFRLMCQWGIAHAAAYVRTVEKALGVGFGSIRWDQVYDPDHAPSRYVPAQGPKPDANACGKFSDTDVKWEEDAAGVLREYLRDKGRKPICDYHNSGWKDVEPKFSIRLLDGNSNPMPLQVVFYSVKSETGTRITDSAGEIPFFDEGFASYEFQVARGPYASNGTVAKVKLAKDSEDGTVTIVKAPPPKPPAITVDDPGSVSGANVSLSASASPDTGLTIASVQFLVDGNPVGPLIAASPYQTNFDTTALINGDHQLSATAVDSEKASTTSVAVTFKIANAVPTVSVTAPADKSTITGNTNVALTATAAAGAGMTLATVQFQVDAVDSGPALASSPYESVLDATGLSSGDHAITAIATDTAGNAATSLPVTVTV